MSELNRIVKDLQIDVNTIRKELGVMAGKIEDHITEDAAEISEIKAEIREAVTILKRIEQAK